jgi:hypothetical protein
MKSFIISFALLLLPSLALAQQASIFRDLTVGNRFVYFARPRYYELDKPRSRDTTYRYYEQVMADTLINTIRYAVVYSSFDRTTRFERSDDTATFVWNNGIETLTHNWNVKNGDSINLSFLGFIYKSVASSVEKAISQPDGEQVVGFYLPRYVYNGYNGFINMAYRKKLGLTQVDIYIIHPRYGLLAALDRDFQGAIIRGTVIGDTSLRTTVVSVDGSEVPITTSLANIPNPFSESVNLEYSIASAVQDVELRITATTGETIAAFKQGAKASGKYTVEWNGKTADGRDVPQGAYIVSLVVNGRKQNDVKVMKAR